MEGQEVKAFKIRRTQTKRGKLKRCHKTAYRIRIPESEWRFANFTQPSSFQLSCTFLISNYFHVENHHLENDRKFSNSKAES